MGGEGIDPSREGDEDEDEVEVMKPYEEPFSNLAGISCRKIVGRKQTLSMQCSNGTEVSSLGKVIQNPSIVLGTPRYVIVCPIYVISIHSGEFAGVTASTT